MEKVIEISGKETKFKASATTTIRYRKCSDTILYKT